MRRLTLIQLCKSVCIGCSMFLAAAQGQTIVRMETNLGNIDIDLYDTATPVTVANFLNYVNSSRYDGTLIHRSVPGFIIQGGDYYIPTIDGVVLVSADPPIVNEYDPSRSNLRGTIVMAKVGSNPDSATSEWFFNLADNSANLDNQNGGFTVFGQVIGSGMDVVDAIAALQLLPPFLACPSPFEELPLLMGAPPNCPTLDQFQYIVTVSSVRVIPYVQGNRAVIVDFAGNYVSFAGYSSSVTLANVNVSDNPALSSTPNGATFSEGFFNLQVNNLTVAGSTLVTMELPAGYLPNTYYMYGPTQDNNSPHWYEFKFDGQTGAEFSANTVALHFVDGARGDSDLVENGQIGVSSGAPGVTSIPLTYSKTEAGLFGWPWLLAVLLLLFMRVFDVHLRCYCRSYLHY